MSLPARLRPLLLVAALSGCELVTNMPSNALHSGDALPADRARLVVYRPAATHLLGVVGDRAITVNGAGTCALPNDGYFTRDVPAGDVDVATGASSLHFTVESGHQYFVRVAFNPRRSSILGWALPAVGLSLDDQPPPTAEAGFFAIETIDAAKARPEVARLDLDPSCR